MEVGTTFAFAGWGGTDSDEEVWRTELAMADLAEPLGFESIWSIEHHFSNYTMVPDVLQFLTYMAGRTTKVKLGSSVVVLPWHDPLRVAEQVSVLDHMSKGRFVLGLGRGTGKIEYDGFRTNMAHARDIFRESAEALLNSLESGVMEYSGQHIVQPRVEIHPKPLRTFKGRVYSASISPESAEIMAKLGTGILIVPQKPWKLIREDVISYRHVYREFNGEEPPSPIVASSVFVDRDAAKAEALARKYMSTFWSSVVAYYQYNEPHLSQTPGYEFHGKMYNLLKEPGGLEKMQDFYIGLQPWGTPDQVLEKILRFTDLVGSDNYLAQFRYGGMPVALAEANMRLFASEVMPALKALPPAIERPGVEQAVINA